MNKLLTHSISTVLLSSAIVMTGCSSDDGASGPAVPVNAADIVQANAFTLVQRASLAGFAITEATDDNSNAVNLTNCDPTGSSSSTVVESGTNTSFTESGQVTLTDCGTWVSGIPGTYFVSGVLTYYFSGIDNLTTFDTAINERVTGNAIGLTTPNDTVTVNGYNVSTTGTVDFFTSSGDYSTSGMFSYDSLTRSEGFSALISTPLTGPVNWFGPDCPTGGGILITGAAGSQARGTFRNDGNVLIEYKPSGSTTWTEDTTYLCSNFES